MRALSSAMNLSEAGSVRLAYARPTNTSPLPDWGRTRQYYLKHCASIMKAGANDWGVDPYQWEFEGGIRLTPIELMFWSDVRAAGVVLYPQYPVGRYFVDFANPAAHVAFECDGAAYHRDVDRDAARQTEIESLGWLVFRIGGTDCWREGGYWEDESGRERYRLSPGTLLLRQACTLRDICFGVAPSSGPRERVQ
jgi:REase_MTES_1575